MVTEEAARQLTGLLVDGTLRPGRFLSIREISDLVGAPIGNSREAVMQLAQAGFLTIHPNRGVQIADITPRHIRSAFAFREVIESHALRFFVAGASDQDIEALIRHQSGVLAPLDILDGPGQLKTMTETNEVLHKAFIASLENVFFSKFFGTILDHINWMRANIKIAPARHREVIAEHLAILAACQARDADEAVRLLAAHLNTSMHLTLFG